MDMSTKYLGLTLANPLMSGASPLVDDLDAVMRLEDAGASAIVMHSLFEEQVLAEEIARHDHMEVLSGIHPEALSYFPAPEVYALGPDAYLEQLRRIRETVAVPVFASLNGSTPGGWLEYARQMEQAGAHAIELNFYNLATDPCVSGDEIEEYGLAIVRSVRQAVEVPLAVKLSPFFSSLPNYVKRLGEAGADGVVLFNRFLQPDIDIENLELKRTLKLSTPGSLLTRLHAVAILSCQVKPSLAITGGVHGAIDVVKSVMAGAHVVQMVSALLEHGPRYLGRVLGEFEQWMTEHDYESVTQMRGSMDLHRCPDPHAFQRGNYIRLLQSRVT